MLAQVGKWGNSLALRIPSPLAREASFNEGKAVDISVDHGNLVVKPVQEPAEYDLDRLLAGITEENLHGETETGPPVGNEAV